MFTTGDKSKWLITNKDQIVDINYSLEAKMVILSSTKETSYAVQWYNRAGKAEDPWISLSNHASEDNTILYGENSYAING